MTFKVPEKYRDPQYSTTADGNNGVFWFKSPLGRKFMIIVSQGEGWEHVSVTQKSKKPPSWQDMCQIKALFWGPEDCVVQYHPPASEYVNNHPGCLHLWRPMDQDMPQPPSIMVGIKGVTLSDS